MKWLILSLLLAVPAMACEKGCYEWQGNCACDLPPKKANPADEPKPSDEAPPRDKMPSYQREGIHADTPQSLIYQDSKMDQDKTQANDEGKRAAGLN